MNPRDIGAAISGVFARIPAVITAGAGNDNVEINGPWVDITAIGTGGRPHSVVAFLIWSATLAAAATLSLLANLQDATSSGGAGAADFGTAYPLTVVATGPGGGGTLTGVTKVAAEEIVTARSFLRLQSTSDLSAATTDTVAIAGIFVFGGFDHEPAT